MRNKNNANRLPDDINKESEVVTNIGYDLRIGLFALVISNFKK